MSQRPDTPILNQVQTPADLKRFSDEELKLLADELRKETISCLLYTSPSPRDKRQSRMPSSA